MEIKVTGRHLEITEAIREYAENKAGKLPRYFDRTKAAEIIAERIHDQFEVEMIAHVDRADPFVAHARGQDLYACIDDLVSKMERQLTDHKDKLRNRKHPE